MRGKTLWVSCMALLMFFASCNGASAQQQPATGGNAPVTSAMSAEFSAGVEHPAPAERNPQYRIGRNDVLLITFPLSPELNQKVIVRPDGYISLQSGGFVRVDKLSLPDVVGAVKKAYAGTLHNPIVDIDLADFQKPFFTVLGQVGKPGQYDLRADITVTQAIAVAGGFTPTAKTQVFLYRAVSSDWAEVRELKLKDVLHGKSISEDLHIKPGDMIFVPEKAISHFKKYVPYSVGLSPPYPY